MLFDPPSWLWKAKLGGAAIAFVCLCIVKYRLKQIKQEKDIFFQKKV